MVKKASDIFNEKEAQAFVLNIRTDLSKFKPYYGTISNVYDTFDEDGTKVCKWEHEDESCFIVYAPFSYTYEEDITVFFDTFPCDDDGINDMIHDFINHSRHNLNMQDTWRVFHSFYQEDAFGKMMKYVENRCREYAEDHPFP